VLRRDIRPRARRVQDGEEVALLAESRDIVIAAPDRVRARAPQPIDDAHAPVLRIALAREPRLAGGHDLVAPAHIRA
jgi:hypothetical protein